MPSVKMRGERRYTEPAAERRSRRISRKRFVQRRRPCAADMGVVGRRRLQASRVRFAVATPEEPRHIGRQVRKGLCFRSQRCGRCARFR